MNLYTWLVMEWTWTCQDAKSMESHFHLWLFYLYLYSVNKDWSPSLYIWKPFALTIKSKALVNPPAWSQCPWESITASTFFRYLIISSQTKVWATEFVRILPRPDWILHQASPHYRTCQSPLVLCWKMLEFENDIDEVRVNWQNLRRKASFCFFRPWLPSPPARAHAVHSIENNPKQSQTCVEIIKIGVVSSKPVSQSLLFSKMSP